MSDREPGFGVYIHWPFCAQKCPYCDFNSHVRHAGWDEPRFAAAYKRELEHLARLTGPRRVESVFIGGGTPSLMQPATVGALLGHVARLWTLDADAEVTLEANPGSVDAGRFAGYRSAGINRVSVGVQSLDDDALRKLGRIHTVAEAKAALDIAHRHFDRVSFDLIYARPGQTAQSWRAELEEALSFAAGHLSLYQLTIEPETAFAALHAAGRLTIPDDDAALNLYAVTQELCEAAGLPAYEVSNHARAGDECRHNLLYWRYGEYAGAGPGAHGRLLFAGGRHATVGEKNPEAWAAHVEGDGHGLSGVTRISAAEEADELLLMGLRLREGVDLRRLEQLSGLVPDPVIVACLVDLGLLEVEAEAAASPTADPDAGADEIRACLSPGLAPRASGTSRRIRATARGRLVLNQIAWRLAASLQQAERVVGF